MPRSIPNILVQTPPGAQQAYNSVVVSMAPWTKTYVNGHLQIDETPGQYLYIGGGTGWFNTGTNASVPYTLSMDFNGQPVASRRSRMRGIEHHFTGIIMANVTMLGGHNFVDFEAQADDGTFINTFSHDNMSGHFIPNIAGNHRFGYSAEVSGVTTVDIPINIGTPGPYVALFSPIVSIGGTTVQNVGSLNYSIDGGADTLLTSVGLHFANRNNDPMPTVPLAWGSVPGLFPALDNMSSGDHVITFKLGPSSPSGNLVTFEGQQLFALLYNPPDARIGTSYRGGVPGPGPATNSFAIDAILSGHQLVPDLNESYAAAMCFSSFTTVAGQTLNTGLIIDTSGGFAVSSAINGDMAPAINPVSIHQPLGWWEGDFSAGGRTALLAWLDTSSSRTTYAWSHDANDRFMAMMIPNKVILP